MKTTIDMTPTWREMVSTFIMLIERGDATGRATAIKELDRMAHLADIASVVLGAHRRPDAPAIPEADAIVAKLNSHAATTAPMMDQHGASLFIVRGRSIDGTVYACHLFQDVASWSSSAADALPMTLAQAERVKINRMERNDRCDADSIIGRLVILPAVETWGPTSPAPTFIPPKPQRL